MTSETLPTVSLPDESGEYKIIQLEGKLDRVAYLRFSERPDDPSEYHMDILERFGVESGNECVSDPDNRVPLVLPDTAPYVMKGAGRCKLNLERKTARFGGNSENYGVGIDQEHLQRIKAELPDLDVE